MLTPVPPMPHLWLPWEYVGGHFNNMNFSEHEQGMSFHSLVFNFFH
jgi:hypothetical protein